MNSDHIRVASLQYLMRPVKSFDQFKEQVCDKAMVRLLGPDRQGIEKQTNNSWDSIVAPRDKDIDELKIMLDELAARAAAPTALIRSPKLRMKPLVPK